MTPEEEMELAGAYYAPNYVPASRDVGDIVDTSVPAQDPGPKYDYWGGGRDVSAEATPSAGADPNPIFSHAVTGDPRPIIGHNQSAFGPVPIYGKTDAELASVPDPGAAQREKDLFAEVAARGAPPTTAATSAPGGGPTATDRGVATSRQNEGFAPRSSPQAYYGGGTSVGPSAYDRGMAGMRATYGDDKSAVQRETDAARAQAEVNAVGGAAIAQQKLDDQAIQQMEAANAARGFEAYSAETQKQIDDVRAKRIDTGRAYSDTGSAVMAVLGGMLGGLYQGLNKLEKNPFIEQMNKTLDRDIWAQEQDLRTQKEGIHERKGLLAEMRATYKDEALAKLQARNLYYEGAKEAIAAQAANFDSPTIQARADQAISALSREQSKLDIQSAIRKAAQAQAASAAAAHRRKEEREWLLKLQHLQNETLTASAGAYKAFKEGGKEHRADVAHVGDKLAEIDKQGVATDLEQLRKHLIDPKTGKPDSSRSIPGVGRLAEARETLAPPVGSGGGLDIAGMAIPNYAAARIAGSNIIGLDPQERQNRNRYARAFLGFKNLKTGAAASEKEHERIMGAWEGAKTTEEVGDAVEQSYQWIQRNKDAIRAENPAATEEYETNLRSLRERDQAKAAGREKP